MKIEVKFIEGNARPSGPPCDMYVVKFSEIDDEMRQHVVSSLRNGNMYLAFGPGSFHEFLDRCSLARLAEFSACARTPRKRKKAKGGDR